MNEMLFNVILIMLTFLGALLTRVVVPYLQAKIKQEDLKTINFWIETALYAAEQLYKKPNSGLDKKDYVRRFIKSKVPDLTDAQLDTLIEGVGKSLGIFKEDESNVFKTSGTITRNL
jgi:hypothetical protein